MAGNSPRQRTAIDYKIACICPMGVEVAPVEAMLDEIHDPLQTAQSRNAYTLGSMGGHNVVVATMPEIGNNAAAATATQLLNDFPAVQFGLLIGIGGGVPGDADVRLGDVVVGQPTGASPGVVQYDMGKELEGGEFQRTGSLNKPPAVLNAHVRKLDGQHERLGHNLSGHIAQMLRANTGMQNRYSSPNPAEHDRLFGSTYKHCSGPTCDQCDTQYLVLRHARPDHEPRIHYGTIGSANKVVKDANLRDRIYADTGALCIEMEAAGLMSDFPCLVIRGICDYADSHKNKMWQPYAAAVAAAYAKALLLVIPSQGVSLTGRAVESTLSPFKIGLHLVEAPIIEDSLFIGRATELQAMEKALQPQGLVQGHRRLVVGGIGGIGKTQLAIAYAKRHCSSYDSVFWLNAASEPVLQQSFRLMAQRILDKDKYQGLDDDRVSFYVKRWLSDIQNTRWLLIFDNYDDPEMYDIGKHCPYGLYGSVIITTRYPEQVKGEQLLIRPLADIAQSLEILATRSKRAHINSDPHALDLAKRLQGLPLGLATAGAYLKYSPWTFQEYLQIYDKHFNVDIHRSLRLPEYRDRTLYTTWDITYTRLEADHPRAAQLLRSFAFFDNQHLQYELFRVSNDHNIARKLKKIRSRFRSLLRDEAEKDFLEWLPRMSIDEFSSAMRTLIEYCFVEVRSVHRDYSIHSCVHDWALSSLNVNTQSNGYWFAFDRIADMVDRIEEDSYAHLKHSIMTPHAVRLAHVSFSSTGQGTSRQRLNSTSKIAGFLYAQDQLQAAEQMHLRALTGFEEALGPDHTSTLVTVNNLGLLYCDQGKLDEAEQMHLRALTGFEKALGPDHTSTLITVGHLGVLYRDQGKLDEAEQMHLRALTGREKALGPDHTLTLTTVNNLGVLYYNQGKLDEAEQMHLRALAGREKALGPANVPASSSWL